MWSNMRKVKVPQIAPLPKSQPGSYQPPSLPASIPTTAKTGQKEGPPHASKPQNVPDDGETPAIVGQFLMQAPPDDPIDAAEEEAESMLKLMEDIKNVREQNKHLGDEERRQNAENIMMKLAAMMDLGSDGEEEYGEQEDALDNEGEEAVEGDKAQP